MAIDLFQDRRDQLLRFGVIFDNCLTMTLIICLVSSSIYVKSYDAS